MAASGAVGASVMTSLILAFSSGFMGPVKPVPFVAGIFGSYFGLGLAYNKMMELYLASDKND